jgi:HEAT repeat protein
MPSGIFQLDEDLAKVANSDKSASKKSSRFSEEMIRECLVTIESGDPEDLFGIIPRIGVLRDQRFHKPLLTLLSHSDLKRRQFAAYAMGAIGDRCFLEPLKKAFVEAKKLRGFGAQELQIAVIEAIGVIGDDAAVDFFLPILKHCCENRSARESRRSGSSMGKMTKWILESLGSIAQQGGDQSLKALIELTQHHDPEIQSQALSELSVAYWHRPNEIADSTLEKIYKLTRHSNSIVAESALAALQNLADVGCRRAEELFSSSQDEY